MEDPLAPVKGSLCDGWLIGRLSGLLACLCLLVFMQLSCPAELNAHPRESWRTLETEHFDVHFPDGGYELALRAASYLEAAHENLVPLLGHTPRLRTQVVLSDDVDFANGSARVVPYPLVRGFMAPPGAGSHLGHYDDFLWLLMVHEYAHVLHLDNAGGILEIANRIFGRQLTPNHLAPKWVIEGIAVWYESLLSAGGRNDSPLADMVVRAQVLEEDELWPLDRVTGAPSTWPGANVWYLFGGRVLSHMMEARGDVVGVAFPEDYGARLLPYALNVSANESIGMTLTEAWESWSTAESARQREAIDALREEGVVEGRRFTEVGRTVTSPRFEPGGSSVLALVAPPDAHPRVQRFDPFSREPSRIEESSEVHRVLGAQGFDLSQDGETMVMAIRAPYRIEQRYDDLWAAAVGGGQPVRLTHGLRARNPALSAEQDLLAFVARRRGETSLYVSALDLRAGRDGGIEEARLGAPVRVFHRPGAHIDDPTFSPGGESLVFSVSREDTGRDLLMVDLKGSSFPPPSEEDSSAETSSRAPSIERPEHPFPGEEDRAPVSVLIENGAQNIQPAFHPSGGALLFSSDKSGVFDLYVLEMEGPDATGELRRLTRTLTGAFEPRVSPCGSSLVYVTYGARGYDLAHMALDLQSTLPPPPPPEPSEPGFPDSARLYPVRSYSPWASLRPFAWSPYIGADPSGSTVGISTGGTDAVGRHSWASNLWLGVDSLQPGYTFRYTYRRLHPDLSLASSRTEYRTSAFHVRDGAPRTFEERSYRLATTATLSIPDNERSHALSVTLSADHKKVLAGIPPVDPAEPVPLIPEDGLSTNVRLSWNSSSVRRYPESHVPFDGSRIRVSTELASRRLGGDFGYARATVGMATHHLLPMGRRQVLAGNVDAGLGLGNFGGRRFFSLGGLPVDDPLALATNPSARSSTRLVRGYPPFSIFGDAFVSSNLEHRFPLLAPERGVGTLPVFFRRLHGALFVDMAYVAPSKSLLANGSAFGGFGAEARAELLLGYNLTLNLRAGVAHGLGPRGSTTPYFGLGGAF